MNGLRGIVTGNAVTSTTRPLDYPFCASSNLDVIDVAHDEGSALAVHCKECGAMGPRSLGHDRRNAIHTGICASAGSPLRIEEQMNQVDLVTNALRDALLAYSKPDGPDTALVIVALFGVSQSKRLAPLLQEIAHNVQRAKEAR